jgi:hypothetical protein
MQLRGRLRAASLLPGRLSLTIAARLTGIAPRSGGLGVPKNVMRLLDRSFGLMECRVCGRRHFAGLGDGATRVRGAWECQNGCELTTSPLPKGGLAAARRYAADDAAA